MGAYLGKPNLDKISTNSDSNRFNVGTCSMQGWRLSQEDSHNSILDFDEDVSLFAVYDGHGGSDVALYAAQNLPHIIKNNSLYKDGKISEALVASYIEFDESLIRPEIIEKMKFMSQNNSSESDFHDPNELKHLREEAGMSIDDVVAKYKANAEQNNVDPNGEGAFANSMESLDSPGGSGIQKEKCKRSSLKRDASDSDNEMVNGDNVSRNDYESKTNGGDVVSIKGKGVGKSSNPALKNSITKNNKEIENIHVVSEKTEESDDDEEDNNEERHENSLLHKFFSNDAEDFGSDSDSKEESSDEEYVDSAGSDSADSSEDDKDESPEQIQEVEVPGFDSGCTAVVALLHQNELYVANAGDSRCVICRDGKAIEMSYDHKPEDEIEHDRIVKAGGRLSEDGRVNGGLNLSRALGDHFYKNNKSLPLVEQMISPLPDIKKLSIDVKTDRFIFIACDGIWNSMNSQEVVDFVNERLVVSDVKLSQICEELFDQCLASDTMGDGTGCDNMTAILITFKDNENGMVQEKVDDVSFNKSKRVVTPVSEDGEENLAKKIKVHDENEHM